MEEYAILIAGFIIVVLLAIGLGLPLVSQLYNQASISSTTQAFSATASVPYTLTSQVSSVNYLYQLNLTNQTNSTTQNIAANYTFTITSLAPISGQVISTHSTGIANQSIPISLNGNILGYLSDNATDTFTATYQNGTNTVTYG